MKQTEQLLKNGYVTGRGKAYASGTAYASGGGTRTTYTFDGSSKYTKYDVTSSKVASNADKVASSTSDAADSAEEFAETFDWIEVRLEEINEQLDLMDAKLQNAAGYYQKNNIVDDMIDMNYKKLENLEAGLKKYNTHAAKLLAEIPAQYRAAAQDGSIAISEFAGEADEKTVQAIENYREWAAKAAETALEIQNVKNNIGELAQIKFDNVATHYDNITDITDAKNEKLENAIDLTESQGNVASPEYYKAMISNTKKKRKRLVTKRDKLQQTLDEAVESGEIKKYDDRWYEMVAQIYDADAAIQECDSDLESFQNSINEIDWTNFDNLIDRLDYLKDETQGLIDLMENDDLFTTPKDKEYWGNDDVTWTDEGLATLGLYAQQMETAEYKAKQYAEAIDALNKDYKAGKYSEQEYLEKLNELQEGQYDSIEAYYEAQDAIVDLNKARLDAVKEGIEKEIEAYEELISKKQEELDAEKD